jgi:hypothetical protein
LKDGIDLSRSGSSANLDVVLSPAAAQLEGSVVDQKDNPVVGAVVLLRSTLTGPFALTLHRQVTTDQRGQFKIQSITPGEYRLIAFEAVEGTDPQDPDLFAQYENSAVKLSLAESAKETKQLKAIREELSAQ